MGKGSSQVITAPYSDKKYNGVVVNEAPDRGTSLISIEPRDRSAVNRMRQEKNRPRRSSWFAPSG